MCEEMTETHSDRYYNVQSTSQIPFSGARESPNARDEECEKGVSSCGYLTVIEYSRRVS